MTSQEGFIWLVLGDPADDQAAQEMAAADPDHIISGRFTLPLFASDPQHLPRDKPGCNITVARSLHFAFSYFFITLHSPTIRIQAAMSIPTLLFSAICPPP